MADTILVVDDDELVRTGLAANLSAAGFTVLAAASGEEAIRQIGRDPIDLVLCDLVLSGMDGIEVLKHFQMEAPEVLVVMITGHGTISNALDALRNGASDYIQKPANPDEVIHRIRSVLDSSRLKQALIHERRKAEERKRELNEHLSRAERMVSLGLLAEGAARDLRGIIEPVAGCYNEVRAALPPGNPVLDKVRQLQEACQKVTAISRDLEAIGRSSTYDQEEVDLNQLVADFIKSPELEALHKLNTKVRIEMHLGPVIPKIRGSPAHLRQILENLIINALEAQPSGGAVSIHTTSEHIAKPVGRYGSGRPGEYVVLRVKDNGAGLAGEDVERFFEPFFIHSKLGRKLLSGLGMTLVYRVVEDHGGYIDVATGPAKGTMFLVFLPLGKSVDAPLELRPDYTGTETVLVIDDYEEHRTAAAGMLRDLGYNVLVAENGRQAVKMVEDSLASASCPMINLALIDLVLGDEFDGVETYKRMLELVPGQKAVLASGFADIARIVEARKLGIRKCIQKPYTADALGKAVRGELDA